MKEFKQQMYFFLKNKLFMISLVITAVLGYGYVLTHGTCGIDDISIDLYFEVGIGVAIGRWPYYLINKVIPIAQYTPFIADLITVVLLMISAVIWCVLLRTIVGENVSIWTYVVFVYLFMNYSMNADVFVFYLQNGLGWVHLFVVLTLVLFLNLYTKHMDIGKQVLIRMLVIIFLTLSISFYESAASLFLTGILVIMFIDLWKKGSQSAFRGKKFIFALIFATRYLIYAMIIRRIVRGIIMRVFAIAPYTFYRSVSSLEWIKQGGIGKIGENISTFLADIYCDYFAVGVVYYPILLFVICSVVFWSALVYLVYKKRDALLAFCGLGIYLSLFILSVISGSAMEYRACQNFTIFVALVFAATTAWVIKKSLKVRVPVGICISLFLICSVYDMNQWFVLDYEKTEYEMQVIDQIAEELKSGKYNIAEKPVVVVGDFELPTDIYDRYCISNEDFGWEMVESAVVNANGSDTNVKKGKYCYAQNHRSIIDWSVQAFAMYAGYNVPMRQLFEYRGYELQWADAAVVEEVFDMFYPLDWEFYSYSKIEEYEETYHGKAQYPNEGYIEEFDEYIVIRL